MKRARLAAALALGLFLALTSVATYTGMNRLGQPPISFIDALWAWSFIGFPLAGALIVSRLPDRPLGWLMLASPVFAMTGVMFSELAGNAAASGGQGATLAWWSNATFSFGIAGLVYIPVLLPDGRLHSRSMRRVTVTLAALTVAVIVVGMFTPGRLAEVPDAPNPFGIAALAPLAGVAERALGPLWFASLGTGAVALTARVRRARGDERLQMRWILAGLLAVLACFGGVFVVERVFGRLSPAAATLPGIAAIVALPLAIAMAVLKHRLYDVDVIINRTLVYLGLSGVLVAVYAASVVVLQQALAPFTAESDLAVAASTLTVAALFGPARRRVQSFIDRRFYRSRYDAVRALERFRARLRDEVELDAITAEALALVHGTLHPAHAGIVTIGRE